MLHKPGRHDLLRTASTCQEPEVSSVRIDVDYWCIAIEMQKKFSNDLTIVDPQLEDFSA